MPSRSAQRESQPPADPPGAPAEFPPQPLKPRPILLAALSVIFALWVAFLVALYVKTEYPHRSTAPRPDARGVPVPNEPT
jgi:hypothetical protein